MRIEQLKVDGFGRLSDWDSGTSPLGSMVVVLGPNEAGKSTLFHFLTTALYGFQPASRENNPHVPWGADEAGGEVRIRLSDGECATVSRRLRSSPAGTVTLREQTRDLRNQPVPWVEHVPRTVFRQVFAVTLAELAGLDEDTWARIQDRVLGSMGATDLLPARAVAESLEKEAGEIWRPNRRGNQRLRILQEEIRALRARRLDALERDREIRGLVEAREDVRHKLREMRGERERDALVLARARELLPVKHQLDRIRVLRRQGGPRSELTELPPDLRAERARLLKDRARLEDELAEVSEDLKGPEAAAAAFDEDARRVLAERDGISSFVARAAVHAEDTAEAGRREDELGALEMKIETAADALLTGEWSESLAARIRTLSIELLRDRVTRWEEAHRREVRTTEEARSAPSPSLPGIGPLLGLAALGAALGAWSLAGGPPVAGAVGLALLAVAATLGILRRALAPDEGRAGQEVGPSEVESARREIETMIDGIPVRTEYRNPPGPALVSGLARLQELLGQREEASHGLDALLERIAARDAEADTLMRRLELKVEGGAEAVAAAAGRTLSEAERKASAAEAAAGERGRLERSLRRLRGELDEVTRVLADLEERVRVLAGDETPDPFADVQERIECHSRADRLAEELARSHPNLEELKERIAEAERSGANWTVDDADLAARAARVEELREVIEGLVARGEALEGEIIRLRERETVDAVDSEMASLREEEARLTAERDRKWLVAQLVREADRRFREEHQPDLIQRASGYLARLTDGRYDRLLVDEEGAGDLFQIVGPGVPKPIPLASPISTGTLEQAYLSLRLAMVDHLDSSTERLPIFVDEALVNWDAGRRDRGLELLGQLSEERQVFAFTCHPEMAERLAERGGRIVRLER